MTLNLMNQPIKIGFWDILLFNGSLYFLINLATKHHGRGTRFLIRNLRTSFPSISFWEYLPSIPLLLSYIPKPVLPLLDKTLGNFKLNLIVESPPPSQCVEMYKKKNLGIYESFNLVLYSFVIK